MTRSRVLCKIKGIWFGLFSVCKRRSHDWFVETAKEKKGGWHFHDTCPKRDQHPVLVSDPIGSIFSKLGNIEKSGAGTGGHTVIHRSSRAHNLLRLLICESVGNRSENARRPSVLGRVDTTLFRLSSTIHFKPVLIVKKRDTSILSAQTRLVNDEPV
jgi:hypothetical protein